MSCFNGKQVKYKKPIIFRHEPKCAGTYIWRHLKQLKNYISLGDIETYTTKCSQDIINFYNITSQREVGVVETDINNNTIPTVIRGHNCLNHLNKSYDDLFIICNTRHPIEKFYSEFYHHRGDSGTLTWCKNLGDNIDDIIDNQGDIKIDNWVAKYINHIEQIHKQSHVVIYQDCVDEGLKYLQSLGFDFVIKPQYINTCPNKYRQLYNYRLADLETIMKPAIDAYFKHKTSYNS